ncbi:MAG TPA: acyl carrier protein [Sphingobacteriaceae bacterium]|nr:acyl carrier protein [Sphingobacteriaceae bacterium]
MTEIIEQINFLARDVFENDNLIVNESTKASEIEEWDSLTHIMLVVAIEKHFGIRFSAREIQSWDNVGELSDSIKMKIVK